MKISKYIIALAAILVVSAPTLAAAQAANTQVAQSFFGRDRNTSVRERPRPDYEAIGVHTGGFTWFPRITAETAYNDNIYASTVKVNDVVFRVRPEVGVRSNWSRNALAAYARSNISRYADNKTENTEEYALGANGRLDFLRASNLYAGADQQWLVEPRTSPTSPAAAARPTQYELFTANAGVVHELTRVRLSGRLDYSRFNYKNNITRTGAPLVQDDRDRDVVTATGRVEYAMTPATAFFVAVKGNWRDYRLQPPVSTVNRDSNGYAATAGVNFELTNLMRGEIEAGYESQSYDSPVFRKGVDGLALAGRLEWFPTQLTTVRLNVARSIEEATVPAAPGFLSTSFGATVDHELLRNLLLTARGSYTRDAYTGVDRRDNRYGAGLGATYLVNHRVAFTVGYDYLKQSSVGTGSTSDYNVNTVSGSVLLQF